jgi:hypothetical protein|tara:strand:+ start:4148 stop:5155 length:1008 start_codon:yes stop_codon:yes gene_type:complete
MASFIVEIENTSNSAGTRPFAWVVVEAANDAEANAKANQGLGANERAGITLPNSDEGFRRLRVSSPSFAAKYGPGGYVSFVENTLGDSAGGSGDPNQEFPIGGNIGDIGGGGGGGNPETTFGPNPALVAEDNPEFQFQQFLSGLGRRGAGTSGAAGRARLNRFSSNQARFLADQVLNPLSSGQAGTFADFTAREPLYGQQANQSASDLFDQAIRLGSGINPTGAGFDNFSEMQQGFLNPVDERGAAQFENLARAKARSQFGVASEFFRPNVSTASQYFAQDAPSAMSFGDFLNNKIFGQAAPKQQMNLGKIGTPVPGFSDDTRSQFEAFAPGMGY